MTYDLGLGVAQRGNNSPKMHEVPAQQWADLTDAEGRYGVTILSDCRYGWDKPADNKLRLTLLHTPGVADKNVHQAELDVGRTHRLRYALAGHVGDWRTGKAVALGHRFNQPLTAAVVASHDGALGRRFEFLSVSCDQVSVMALKQAERTDEIVVRVRETYGRPLTGARIRFAARIESAVEVDGQELHRGNAIVDGNEIRFDLAAFQPKAFSVRLERFGSRASKGRIAHL
jgi:alpha-mannosidase